MSTPSDELAGIVMGVIASPYATAGELRGNYELARRVLAAVEPRIRAATVAEIVAALDDACEAWRQQFGGGMVPFDRAYHEAFGAGATAAESQAAGVAAALEAFVAHILRDHR